MEEDLGPEISAGKLAGERLRPRKRGKEKGLMYLLSS